MNTIQEEKGGEIYIQCPTCQHEDSFFDTNLSRWKADPSKEVNMGNPCNGSDCESYYAVVKRVELEK